MQDVRVEIDPTRPAHRSGDRVDAGAVERCVIVDCSKYTWERIVEVQLSHQAIGEDDAQEAITEVLNTGNTGRTSHRFSLWTSLLSIRSIRRRCRIAVERPGLRCRGSRRFVAARCPSIGGRDGIDDLSSLPGLGFHDLRRFYATLLVETRADVKISQELMGHQDIRMTRGLYAQAGTGAKRRANDAIAAELRLPDTDLGLEIA